MPTDHADTPAHPNAVRSRRAKSAGRYAALCFASLAWYADAVACSDAVIQYELENGIDVYHVDTPRAPVALVMLWFPSGSNRDPAGRAGTAHFLEHMMFQTRSGSQRTHQSIWVDAIGGYENAATNFDYTTYYARVSADRVDDYLTRLGRRLTEFKVDADALENERQVIRAERAQSVENRPVAQLYEGLRARDDGAAYSRPVIGTWQSISAISAKDLRAYFEHQYALDRAFVVAIGDLDGVDAKSTLARTIGALSLPTPPDKRATEDKALQERTATGFTFGALTGDRGLIAMRWGGMPDIKADADSALAHWLLSASLGVSGRNGLLYRSFVVEKNVATSLGTEFDPFGGDRGAFYAYGRPQPPATAQTVAKSFRDTLTTIARTGLSRADRELAEARILRQVREDCDGLLSFGYGLGEKIIAAGAPIDVEQLASDLSRLADEEIRSAAGDLADQMVLQGTAEIQ